MTTRYCLTVEVESEAIENGLGYMIGFTLPAGAQTPQQAAGFDDWRRDVTHAVLRAGDKLFDADPYAAKLAVAELMNELAALNACHAIQIGGGDGLPAVQVRSSNYYDPRIDIDFTGKDGHFTVRKRTKAHYGPAPDLKITAHGHTGCIPAARDFPFTQESVPEKPAPKRHARKKPSGPRP
ncbi:MAG: hypothetical protein GC185_03680 [Alphaproteobacteria bacterium]|nr:hypothetical protein [Alphaproteobacteria bacterium]